MSRLPAAVSALLATLVPASLTLRSTARAALSRIAPEVRLVRLAVEAIRMSRPEFTVIAAAVSARPELVACMLPLSVMSLAAPLLLSVTKPLPPVPAVMVPITSPVTELRPMSLPAASVAPLMLAVLLVIFMSLVVPVAFTVDTLIAPGAVSVTLPGAVTVKPLVLKLVPAPSVTVPAVAVMSPNAPMLVPAASATVLALSETRLLSLRAIWPLVATRFRLPTALTELLAPLAPASLTLRSMLRAAASRTPPLVAVAMLVVEASRTSRPALTEMPFCTAVSAVLVAIRLPFRLMSLPAPVAVRAITPLPVLNAPRLMEAAPSTVMEVPAIRLPTPTPALLLMAMKPAVALRSLVVMPAPVSTRF